MKKFAYGKAICYSGYRVNQSPRLDKYPSYEEILEDLTLLETDFDYIRLYDPSHHAKTALKVIRDEKLDLKVLLGLDLLGEISNPLCPWGGTYTDEEITNHITYNDNQLDQCLTLVKEYDELIVGLSAGNESIPEWNDNLVSVERILYFVKSLKRQTNKPVTYCENVNYWNEKLDDIVNEIDFISIHSYPAWIGFSPEKGIEQTIDDYNTVTKRYPNKPCIITEAGWPLKVMVEVF
ncbi:MAG: hypothetical protein K9K32_07525 [Halanaerobiales bacterium]|nr:hypothetical protein [Halanaerobiales bacterium]